MRADHIIKRDDSTGNRTENTFRQGQWRRPGVTEVSARHGGLCKTIIN